MLFAGEIAQIYKIVGINQNKPHAQLVGVIMNDYVEEFLLPYRQLYFKTHVSMAKVYDKSLWKDAMEWFLRIYSNTGEYISKSGKTFKFKVV